MTLQSYEFEFPGGDVQKTGKSPHAEPIEAWAGGQPWSIMNAFVYILRCRDGGYYVGSARGGLERRVNEHNSGTIPGYTKSRRPVELVFSQDFDRIADAVAAERRIKGWSRAKKEALMRGDFDGLVRLSRNRSSHPSTGSG